MMKLGTGFGMPFCAVSLDNKKGIWTKTCSSYLQGYFLELPGPTWSHARKEGWFNSFCCTAVLNIIFLSCLSLCVNFVDRVFVCWRRHLWLLFWMCRNPFDILRKDLLTHIRRMRVNFIKAALSGIQLQEAGMCLAVVEFKLSVLCKSCRLYQWKCNSLIYIACNWKKQCSVPCAVVSGNWNFHSC